MEIRTSFPNRWNRLKNSARQFLQNVIDLRNTYVMYNKTLDPKIREGLKSLEFEIEHKASIIILSAVSNGTVEGEAALEYFLTRLPRGLE